jgi:hypothetical protein
MESNQASKKVALEVVSVFSKTILNGTWDNQKDRKVWNKGKMSVKLPSLWYFLPGKSRFCLKVVIY